MFGSKKKETTPPASKKNTAVASTSNSLNSLVKGTKIEGTVTSENDIRIDGTILGTLICSAKVIVGPTGVIEGDVKCENAIFEGRFKGTLDVAQLLTVKETAEIHGDVITNKLLVQSGATFNVTCRMGASRNKTGQTPLVKKIHNQRTSKSESIGQKAAQQAS